MVFEEGNFLIKRADCTSDYSLVSSLCVSEVVCNKGRNQDI